MTQRHGEHFQTGRLWFFPAAIACLRLQEMRRRSRGRGGAYTLASVERMSPAEAGQGFAIATTAALGQFAVSLPQTRLRIFSHVVSYVQAANAMDGLESLMLSGIDAAYLCGAMEATHKGILLWNRLARSHESKHGGIAVFLAASQRVGFLGDHERGGLPQFGALGKGEGDGVPGSVFSPGMPGGAIGRQLASAMSGGIENMDGGDVCRGIVKYGTGVVGGLLGYAVGTVSGAAAGSAAGPEGAGGGAIVGGAGGAFVGFGGGVALGKEIGADVCGGSSTAQPGASGPAATPAGGDQGTYIGEVDDPNFVTGGQPGTGAAPSSGAEPSSGTGDQGTYIGEVDNPNFVSGGQGSSGDSSSGSTGSGSGTDSSGSGGGTDSSGSGGGTGTGGMDNPETGTGEGRGGGSSGLDNPEADPSSGRGGAGRGGQGPLGGMDNPETGTTEGPAHGGRGPLGGMDNPETGVGEGPLPKGFLQGGYAVTSSTFATEKSLRDSVRALTPALYSLQALPLTAESSMGAMVVRAGILEHAISGLG